MALDKFMGAGVGFGGALRIHHAFGIVNCIECKAPSIVSFRRDQKKSKCRKCGAQAYLAMFTKRRADLIVRTSDNLDELRRLVPEYAPLVGSNKPFWCYISSHNLPRAEDPVMPAQGGTLGNGKPLGNQKLEVEVGVPPASVGNSGSAEVQDDPRWKSKATPLGDGAAVQESASRERGKGEVVGERGAPVGGQGDQAGGERKPVEKSTSQPQVVKSGSQKQAADGNSGMGQDQQG